MPHVQRHPAYVDIFELEAFEHGRSDPRGVLVRDEAGRSLPGARSIPACGPKRTATTDWPGHRADSGMSVGVMPSAWGARRPPSRADADRRIAIVVAAA
jgi:hypothetical protein